MPERMLLLGGRAVYDGGAQVARSRISLIEALDAEFVAGADGPPREVSPLRGLLPFLDESEGKRQWAASMPGWAAGTRGRVVRRRRSRSRSRSRRVRTARIRTPAPGRARRGSNAVDGSVRSSLWGSARAGDRGGG
jgi:hypothetical protein